jgi:thioredoxin reductase (NADPH)
MTETMNHYDAVVIGGGPAGLTAAIYLSRARYRTLVVEKDRIGGQITITHEVVNYPGVLATTGEALTRTMRQQAEGFGAEFKIAEVTNLDMDPNEDGVKIVHTDKGDIACHAVLMATGASPLLAGFEGEEDFQGHGVAYCATCDGEFFTGKEVLVVGGGFAAAEEAAFLTKYASHVTILVRKDDFSCAASVSDPAKTNPKITIRYNTRIASIAGDTALRSAVLENTKTGERETWKPAGDNETFGVFVFAGNTPATELANGIAEVDDRKFIVIDEHNMTTKPGLFAAGDVCNKALRQVATAVGEAASTASEMERYIKAQQETTGLIPQVKEPEQLPAAPAKAEPATARTQSGGLFTGDVLAQLNAVFARMETSLVLRLSLDDRPVSTELRGYMEELAKLTDKLSVDIVAAPEGDDLPKVELCRADGAWTGLAFHGVPAGHEFTPFVLGLYNASSAGQAIEDADRAAAYAIDRKVDITVAIGLSCTMCPDLVQACQRIATLNDNVTAQVYDVAHFPSLQQKYDIMSVPCLIINDGEKETVEFGRKNISGVLELIG